MLGCRGWKENPADSATPIGGCWIELLKRQPRRNGNEIKLYIYVLLKDTLSNDWSVLKYIVMANLPYTESRTNQFGQKFHNFRERGCL